MNNPKYYLSIDVISLLAHNRRYSDKKFGELMRGYIAQAYTDDPQGPEYIEYKIYREPSVRRYISPKERQTIYMRDDYTCSYCGKRGGKLEIDHVVPICRGGIDDIENMATSCMSCNRSKGSKLVEEWCNHG
jgi:hypothetical protein